MFEKATAEDAEKSGFSERMLNALGDLCGEKDF
jgi:hypothetical protein